MGATVESGKIGVFGGLGGVKFIDQIILMPQTFEAFLLQIGFGPETRTFAFDFVQCAVLSREYYATLFISNYAAVLHVLFAKYSIF